MAVSQGSTLLQSDLTNYYDKFNTFIHKYVDSGYTLNPTTGFVKVADVTGLNTLINKIANDAYMSTRADLWTARATVPTRGELVTIYPLAGVQTVINNMPIVKCRNDSTNYHGANSCGAKSCGACPNTQMVVNQNDTCLNCTERNSCLKHGTCSNGNNSNCGRTLNGHGNKVSGTCGNGVKTCGRKTSGSHSKGSNSVKCGSGYQTCSNGVKSCGYNGNGAWNQTTKYSGTHGNACTSGTNTCGYHGNTMNANTLKTNTTQKNIVCTCSSFTNN